MLPYWYTLFHEYHTKGHPVVRPLFYHFFTDAGAHVKYEATELEAMVGDALLVRGIVKPLAEENRAVVFLPKGASVGKAGAAVHFTATIGSSKT